jgi:oligopeptide/dipeptide ABC transporter ATP-binding protein
LEALLSVKELKKYFPVKQGIFAKSEYLKAVDGVSLEIEKDRVFGIVGESGSGKSTLARVALALVEPTSGEVLFKGRNVFNLQKTELKQFRRSVQVVFQDPFASLNPRRTVYDAVAEPLIIHDLAPGRELKEKVASLLSEVGLGPEVLSRYPHEFSGGQRQRICIARALAVSPEVIIADEPLSALDVSIQAQILNILKGLKERTHISFIFISHDLRVVEYFSDEVAVMYLGKIVEQAGAEDLFREPLHPYTEGLFASAPALRPGKTRREAPKGDVPSPVHIPPGCPFHTRCPKRFAPCDNIVPPFMPSAEKGGRLVACHLWNPY